eukprot:COSAG04_NODE_270_length_18507_cov_125.250380_17_plen_315_part_00
MRVQAQFREMEGGYHRANVELKAYLRDGWVLPALPVLVEESAAVLGEGASEAAREQHAKLCVSVGRVLDDNGKYEPALAHYEIGLEVWLALEGPEGLGVAACYMNMGSVHDAMGEPDRALELLGQAAAIEEANTPGSVGLAATYNSMGGVHGAQEDYERALERWGQAAAIYEAKDPDAAALPYNNMALVYMVQEDYGKSLEYHRKALAINERVHGPRHPALSQYNMGLVFYNLGDNAGALTALGKALAIWEQVYGPQSKLVGNACRAMAMAYKAQGEREQARAFYERAAAAFAAALGPEHEGTVEAREKAAEMA